MKTFVVGFLIDRASAEVVLIRKNRPAWQRGRYNGVGGHVEPNETPEHAMRREFREETGHDRDDWKWYVTLKYAAAEIIFFRAFAADLHSLVASATDEVVAVLPISFPTCENAIPNITWLIPMALSIDADAADAFVVNEVR